MRKSRRKDPDEPDEHRSSRERIRDLETLNAELRDSEERLRILFEQAPDAYYLTDLKGTLVDGNAAAEAITGYMRDELIGKSFLRLKLLSPRDLPRAAALLERNAGGQSTGPDEFVLNRKDGTQAFVEIRTHPIRISDRSLILGIARDITDRKQAEMTLRESEEMARALLNATTDSVLLIDSAGVVIDANNKMAEGLGTNREALLGTVIYDCLPPDLADQRKEWGREAACQRKPIRFEDTREGRWFENTVYPVFEPDGELSRFAIYARDITERRETDETLRESEHYLKEAQAMARLGHWKLDPATQEVTGSDELFRIFGLSREETTFDAFVQVVHPDDRELDTSHIKRGIEYGEDWDIQHRLICRDGAEKTVHAIGHAIADETGKTILLVGTVQDITEQVRAEEQIRVEKDFTDTALDTQLDTFFLFEPATGKAVRWNRAFRDVTGYTDEEIARMPAPASYYGPEDLERAGAFLENVMEEATGTIVLDLICKDGRAIPTEYRVSVIYDDQGQPRHIISIGRDITRRKETQKALRDSEERFRSIVSQSVDGIALVDADGKIVIWNTALETITGIPIGEAVGRDLWDVQYQLIPAAERPSEELQRLKEIAEAMLRGEESAWPGKYLEYTIERPDGERRVIQLANFLVDIAERPTLGTIVRDTTEYKQAQDALREREQESQAFVETSRDWIWSIDLQGIHTYSNPAIETILGYTPDELIGGTSLDLLHPDDRRDIEAKLPGWIAEKRGWRNLVLRWGHKDGTWRWLESNAVPVFDAAGELTGFRGVDRDITERRRAERQLREALEGTIQAVAGTIETRDPYTAGHQQRVTKLAVAIARRLGLPDEQVEGIRVASTLHDIGKMSTPAEILSKPGKLSEHEFRLIREHPKIAYTILEGIAFPWPVGDIVLQHHERLDGTGYPEGLAGDDIRLEARIIAVADTVEAMSSHRPYRPALGVDRALTEMKQSKGILYDPDVVDACIALFEEDAYALEA